jgi:integrase
MAGMAGGSWLRSVFPPDGPPGLVVDTGAMADRGCREQHKSNTSPGIGEDQHAGNTNKTAFRGTTGSRARRPILLNIRGSRMDRHAATRRLHRLAECAGIQIARAHLHMLRHTFVTTMLDAGVDLRDVQIAARHADPRTTMRYDRARQNLDRPPNYPLAAYMASGT